MKYATATLLLLTAMIPGLAAAETYMFDATCYDSYSKQGGQQDDLSAKVGTSIRCDFITLSLLNNGHVLLQVIDKQSKTTPLGFGGPKLDNDINPKFVTLPIERIYLPHSTNPSNAEAVSGAEGYCFLDGKLNLQKLSSLSCASKIEIGDRKLIYKINAKILKLGEVVPGI